MTHPLPDSLLRNPRAHLEVPLEGLASISKSNTSKDKPPVCLDLYPFPSTPPCLSWCHHPSTAQAKIWSPLGLLPCTSSPAHPASSFHSTLNTSGIYPPEAPPPSLSLGTLWSVATVLTAHPACPRSVLCFYCSLLPLERPLHWQERWSLLLTEGSLAPREYWHSVGTQELRARSACVNESWRKRRWQVQGPHDCSRREERTCPVSELVTGEREEECPARDPWSLRRWHLDAPQGQRSVGLQMGSRAGEGHSTWGCGSRSPVEGQLMALEEVGTVVGAQGGLTLAVAVGSLLHPAVGV